MNASTPIHAAAAISTYLFAKDRNRPRLMKDAFASDCKLEMVVKTDAISFPSSANGLDEVTQILVTNFGDQYENVRTFCLARPSSEHLEHFRCDWLARNVGKARRRCSRRVRTL